MSVVFQLFLLALCLAASAVVIRGAKAEMRKAAFEGLVYKSVFVPRKKLRGC